jgi:hypothetical protein
MILPEHRHPLVAAIPATDFRLSLRRAAQKKTAGGGRTARRWDTGADRVRRSVISPTQTGFRRQGIAESNAMKNVLPKPNE